MSTKGTNEVLHYVRTFQETFEVIYTKVPTIGLLHRYKVSHFHSPPHIFRRSTILNHMS